MKIKTKKQLNLPQLIEWAWDNDIKGERFETGVQEGYPGTVRITDGRGILIDRPVFEGELFTVEVEEEITEDTVFGTLLEIRGSGIVYPYYLEAINDQMDDYSKEFHAYIDGEFKLIWHDGKLVE